MIKKLCVIVLSLLTGLCGCDQTQKGLQEPEQSIHGIPVEIADGTAFPSFLAGIWRQEGEVRREFVITPDGRLTSAVVGMGLVRVSPNEERRIPLIDGNEGFYVPGPWTAHYDPATRVLSIGIEISSFRMESYGQVVEGVIRDTFEGPITDDGTQWQAHYFALPEYHAFTPEGGHHVLKDGGTPEEQELLFHRVYAPLD
jgi:hypothetical protein